MESILGLLLVMCFCSLICMGCREEERQALLAFKQSLDVGGDELFNWKGRNCCNWAGVGCSNTTEGNVIQLSIGSIIMSEIIREGIMVEDYYSAYSSSHLDNSLSSLKHLQHLDLRFSSFNNSHIPQFIGSFTSLKYLDLSYTDFCGGIPPHLGNLTHLQYLNLRSYNGLKANSLQWLSNLSSLQYLDMAGVNLTDAVDWPLVFNKFPALSVLRLRDCGLQFFSHSTSGSHANSSSITSLDLSSNSFDDITTIIDWLALNLRNSLVQLDLSQCSLHGAVPHSIGNLSSLTKLHLNNNDDLHGFLPRSLSQLSALEDLDLSDNSFEGFDPEIITNLCSLRTLRLQDNKLVGNLSTLAGGRPRCKRYYMEYLDLSNNQLNGSLPYWIGQMENLKTLNFNNNNLNGSLPESLGQLSELVSLDLSVNSLQGVLSDAHFANMTKLEELLLTGNHLIFNITSTWLPPFQLKQLYLRSCQIGPQFPLWLRTQNQISYLDISNVGIVDEIPSWFWNASSGVETLNISHNQIRGQTPTSLEFLSASFIDLSWNQFHGNLPYLNTSIGTILFNDNMFSGDLQPVLGKTMSSLELVLLSRNFLTGVIPSAICNCSSLNIIDTSDNNLSGEFPNCPSTSFDLLDAINLASNYLSGSIPDWICGAYGGVTVLHLGNNNISGEIPFSFRNCSAMRILNLGGNKLTGELPSWIGENLTELQFLNLRSNMFMGKIPAQMSYLTSLQVLDLAHNDLQGVIPSSFKKLTAMAKTNRTEREILGLTDMDFTGTIPGNFEEIITAVVKGREVEYTNTLSLVMTLDLSCNRLSGEIPIGLMDLVGLQSLNLSGNQLKGKIPDNFGGMRLLESLDLSMNQLSGSIPGSITLLTSLEYLNLSYNNLSGRIPTGDQLRTLTNTSIYVGNRDLCGFPLPKCPGDEPSEPPLPSSSVQGEDEDSDSDMFGLFLSMGLGYATGLWGICGILLFKTSWRIAYFRFFDDMADRLYVAKEILTRRIQTAIRG